MRKGTTLTAENKAKIAASQRRRFADPAAREKVAAGMRRFRAEERRLREGDGGRDGDRGDGH